MVRCPLCHRRLAPAGCCPRDGSLAPSAAAPAAPVPPALPGHTITTWLGAGGFAQVWQAIAEVPGAPAVAVKVSHAGGEAARAQLGHEADVLGRVGPPHVPALFGQGVLPDGRPYLVMERLGGRSLAELLIELDAATAAPGPRALDLSLALLTAVQALHERGVVHRDLKPENVFVRDTSAGPVATLIDFGLHQSDRGAGTPEYMAPELIAGQPAEIASDVYALGAMLFELLTLRPPFVGDRPALEYAHLSFRAPAPSRLSPCPPGLDPVVLRCLAKDPAARWPDAGALREGFARAVTAAGAIAVPAEAAPTEARPSGAARQKTALLFLRDPGLVASDVVDTIARFGGHLAHLAPGRCACAFTHRAGERPAERAWAAAQALWQAQIARRLIVDLGAIAVKPRPDGPPRFSSALFADETRYPRASDPEGVQISAAAEQTLARDRGDAGDQPPLIGRDAELQTLLAEAARALGDRQPRVASVLGEPGLGKSHLARALRDRLAQTPGTEIIVLTARAPLGADRDEPLVALLRRGLELPEDADLPLLERRLGAAGRETVAAAAWLLGWCSLEDPTIQSLRAAPGALRTGVARAGRAALQRLAELGPTAVLLDDAHHADNALLDALEQATVSALPLWIAAFARPSFAASRPGWGQRARHLHTVQLTALAPDGAAGLCRHLLAPATHVPEPLIDRLLERTQGVPLLICELVRGLRREGLVRQAPGGVWYVASEVLDQLSDSPLFDWLASRQLDQLPPELAAHARLVALLAPGFTVDEVQGVLDAMDVDLANGFPLDAQVGLARLVQAGLLQERGAGRFGFRTEVMRDSVARTISDAARSRIHLAALAHHRSQATIDEPSAESLRWSRLAWHAAAAGARGEAAAAYQRCAEQAHARHVYLEAELCYGQALAQLDPGNDPGRLQAHRGRGIMRYRLGRYDDSLLDLAEAHLLAARSNDPITLAQVMLDESTALDWSMEWQRSHVLAESARALLGPHPPAALEARVLLAIGRSLHRFNRDSEAAATLRRAARLAHTVGDACYEDEVVAELLLGFLLPFIGQPDEAEQRLASVEQLCQRKGDEMHLAAMWNNRSCLWIAQDDRAGFLADNARVHEYSRRMGNANLERYAHLNRAIYLYWRGEFDQAAPAAREVIAIDERYFRQGGFRPDGAVVLARILWGQGEHDAAAALVAQIQRQQAEARALDKRELLLLPNDQLLLDMTALLVDSAPAPAWETLVARAREVAQGQELIEVLELAGLAAARRHDPAGAARWWQQALQVDIPSVMFDRIRQRLRAP